MPKVKSTKTPSAPGLTGVSIPGPSRPLIPRSRGVQAARDPMRDGRFWRPSSTAVKLDFTPVYRRWLREVLSFLHKHPYVTQIMKCRNIEMFLSNVATSALRFCTSRRPAGS
ncbi:hypothetical protein Bbelb_353080 [Branchiostoma belcheri]|nr:hypothetical protein Bbelb_353080 [Branchiostoma belcheri]